MVTNILSAKPHYQSWTVISGSIPSFWLRFPRAKPSVAFLGHHEYGLSSSRKIYIKFSYSPWGITGPLDR